MATSQSARLRSRFVGAVVVSLFGWIGGSELKANPVQWTVAEGGNGDWYDLVMPDSYQYSYTWTQARAAADSMTWDGLQGRTYGFIVEFGGGVDQGVPLQGQSVPEPSSLVLLGFGAFSLVLAWYGQKV